MSYDTFGQQSVNLPKITISPPSLLPLLLDISLPRFHPPSTPLSFSLPLFRCLLLPVSPSLLLYVFLTHTVSLSPPPVSTEVCCLLRGHSFGLSYRGQELHQAAGGRPVHPTSPAKEHLYDVIQWGPGTKVCVRHEFPVHWCIQGNR